MKHRLMDDASLFDGLTDATGLKLRLAIRAAGIGIWDWDLLTNQMEYTARAREIFGFAPDQVVTFDMVRAATHPEDYPRTSGLARRALDPNIRAQEPYEYRVIRGDTGAVRWVRARGEAVFENVDGAVRAVRYVGTVEDIHQQKLQHEALDGLATRLQLAIEAAGMAVWEYDVASEEVTTSPELNRLYGFDAGARPSIHDFRQLYFPGEQQRVQAAAMNAIERGESRFEVEFRIQPLHCEPRWMMLRAELRQAADGAFVKVIGVVMDIELRKRAEAQLQILVRELNHRVKNSLSIVQALVARTFRPEIPVSDAVVSFRERIAALAKANDALVETDWRSFNLRTLVERIVAPYRENGDDDVVIHGDPVDVSPNFNVPLALALHEMCTNAAKYGALSVPSGRVNISWEVGSGSIALTWLETGGPAPQAGRKGFGTKLLTEVLAKEFLATNLQFRPEGAALEIVLPFDHAAASLTLENQ
jgi:PAS domain S-box-containing protein